jgi:hypothetical protein
MICSPHDSAALAAPGDHTAADDQRLPAALEPNEGLYVSYPTISPITKAALMDRHQTMEHLALAHWNGMVTTRGKRGRS